MGAVYAAEHQILGQEVALKLLLDDGAHDSASVQRFVNEARAAAKIQGEHVVRVFDVDTLPDGKLFIAMELLNGEDLGAVLQREGTLQPSLAVDYVLQAMEALAQAHKLGIVHRDLKPPNLFVVTRPDGEQVIKVLDFGVAKVRNQPNVDAASTHTTAVFGTPFFMSPEQIRSAKAADAQSDLWSLGVILFNALTGTLPFQGETFGELCFSIIEHPAPSVDSLRPEISAELSAVISRCLERDKEKRFRSAGELAAALRPFASDVGARSAARVLAIESGGSLPPPAPAKTEVLESEAEPGPALPATAGNWVASQPSTGGSGSRKVWLSIGAVAILLLVATALAMRTTSPTAGAPTSASAPASAAPVEVAPVASALVEPPTPVETPAPSALPTTGADAGAPKPRVAATKPTQETPKNTSSATKPTTTAKPTPPASTSKPASSGNGIVTDMGWK
jgi:serine/threonine-protein kinase